MEKRHLAAPLAQVYQISVGVQPNSLTGRCIVLNSITAKNKYLHFKSRFWQPFLNSLKAKTLLGSRILVFSDIIAVILEKYLRENSR